jgi:hypothetical protein
VQRELIDIRTGKRVYDATKKGATTVAVGALEKFAESQGVPAGILVVAAGVFAALEK